MNPWSRAPSLLWAIVMLSETSSDGGDDVNCCWTHLNRWSERSDCVHWVATCLSLFLLSEHTHEHISRMKAGLMQLNEEAIIVPCRWKNEVSNYMAWFKVRGDPTRQKYCEILVSTSSFLDTAFRPSQPMSWGAFHINSRGPKAILALGKNTIRQKNIFWNGSPTHLSTPTDSFFEWGIPLAFLAQGRIVSPHS